VRQNFLHISEHETFFAVPGAALQVPNLPALASQSFEITKDWKEGQLAKPNTQLIRVIADEECWFALTVDRGVNKVAAIRLIRDQVEMFAVPRGRAVYFAVKGVGDE
jgi:hypothetical protein